MDSHVEEGFYVFVGAYLTGTGKGKPIADDLTNLVQFVDAPATRALIKPVIDEAMRRGGWATQ